MKSIVKTSTLLLTLLSSIIFATTYNVSGIVQLEDQMIPLGDHSGVKVNFFNLPSMDAEDSTTTNTDGLYSINISPGYYLVEWTKSGYVPWELGGLTLAENTVLDSITLIPGAVSEVSGTVNSATWTTSFVYYVTDDVTVPAGQTLTINPGVRVRFLEGKSMTVDGTLLANGTEDAHVKFTSKDATPLPGDWGNLTLNGENNVITYMDYDYATDGITGTSPTGTSIDHLTIQGNLASTANGIKFNAGENYSLTNNNISIGGSYGIYLYGANNSDILNNIITTSNTYGIRADYSDNSLFDNNDIVGQPSYGIYSYYNENSTFSNNSLDINQYGLGIRYGDSLTIIDNTIELWGSTSVGVEFYDSENCIIKGNNISNNAYYSPSGIKNTSSGSNAIIKNNIIQITDAYDSPNGVYVYDAIIDSNTISISSGPTNKHYARCIQGGRNTISNNSLNLQGYYDCQAIYVSGNENEPNSIINNTINFSFLNYDNCSAIRAAHADIRNNTIIGTEGYVAKFDGGDVLFIDNYVETNDKGLNISNTNTTIKGNTIVTGERGIDINNSSTGTIYNNTLVTTSGDYGVYQNQTNVGVYNNIFVGFNNGIYVDNTVINFNLAHNLFWDIDVQLFEGSALPPIVGNMIDQNANGLASDIYYNIEFDPLFVEPDSNNFSLQAASPAVNAGAVSITDADSSVSDIGAYYYHIYVMINHAALDNTDDITGPYRVNSTIVSTDGLTPTGSVFYSVDGGDITEIAMTDAGSDAFYADIPGQALNTTVQYYISGSDGTHTSTLPFNVSNGGYSFFVSLFSQFANMYGTSAANGDIELAWGTPTPISGTLTGLKLYKSTDPNVALTETYLIQELDANATTFTDTDTEEGAAYYYRLTGVLDSGAEALVSDEISVVSDNSTLVRLMGVVQLADATFPPDHSGVKVLMEAVSPTAASDSMVTDVTGEFNVVLSNGMYNVHFTKDGYQPITQGDMFLVVTTTMDTLLLERGGSRNISGDIHGTLSGDTLYFVTGDMTVPAGDTLTVEAGTNVLFNGNYSFNSNGLILVNGTENNMVSFTSSAFTPVAGDWGGVNVYETNSRLSYANIHYSTSALYVSNVDSITIEGCNIKSIASGSDGIRIYEPQYANIRNNTIDAPGAYGIRKVDSNNNDSSTDRNGYEIVGNTIIANSGINIERTQESRIDSNIIYVETNYGIRNRYGSGSVYNGNQILPSDDYYEYGFYVSNSNNIIIKNNEVQNARYSFDLYSANNDSVIGNNVVYNGSYNSSIYGFREYYSNNYFYGNNVTIYKEDTYLSHVYAFIPYNGSDVSGNKYIKNKVIVGTKYSGERNRGFYGLGENAIFQENYVEIYNTCCDWSSANDKKQNSAIQGTSFTSTKDTLVLYDDTHGMWGTNISAAGTIIRAPEYHSDGYEAIYIESGEAVLENVLITGIAKGIKTNNGGANLKRVTIETSGDYGIYSSGTLRTVNIEQSTFVSVADSTGTGILLEDGVSLNMNSTIVDGYGTGLNASSEATLYSNLFNNSSNYTGDGIADGTGVDNYFNINGDVADMFGSLQMDPQFVDRDGGDYHPSANSPLIDAGSASLPDPDGSLPDIGSYFFNFGYTPKSLTTVSMGDGTVTLSWDIVETDSLTGYQPYYKLATEDTWAATLLPTTDMAVEYTNLTNNALYDFAVSALYLVSESNKSPTIQAKPGVPELGVSPRVLIANSNEGDSTAVPFVISNTGSKDLSYTVVFGTTLGTVTFTKENYADYNDPSNWDIIIEDEIAITRQNNHSAYNPYTQGTYADYIDGIEWAWGSTEVVMANDGIGIDGDSYTTEFRWFKRDGPNNSCCNSGYYLSDDNPDNVTSMHLIEQDLYFDVEWHFWQGSNNGGGFSYTRTHVGDYGSSISSEPITGTIVPDESETLSAILFQETNGLYPGIIALESNDPIHPTDTLHTLNIVGSTATLSSLHFTPIDTTTEVFYYVIESASIDDYSLETGDEIALFDGDVCVGAGMYNGVMPFLVKAWGTVPPDEPGFDNGDSITVQAWDFGESRIASMEATHLSGSETFLSGGFEEVSLTGTIYHTQDIAIQGGMFNLISSYLYPELPSSSTFFGGLEGLRIVYEDNGSALIPEYGINTIGDIELTEGYHLFADGSNQTLTVSGLAINPSDWTITLQPSQFNSIAYLHNGPMDAELAMAGIANVVNIVQDDAGNAWIPELGVTMGNLNPGKGYQVFTTSDTAVTFSYGTYVAPTARIMAMGEKSIPTQYSFQKTGSPYTIVIQSAVIDGHPLASGDEIAVFDGNLCVGATVWDSETTNIISAWKGNSDYELPGYTPGNTMTFQVYKSRFKTAVDVVSTHPTAEEKAFNGSSYSRTSISGSPGLIPEQFALMQNYPNPFNPITNIRYNVADDSPVTMVVYNIMGQEVIRLMNNDIHAPGKYSIVWNGLNQRGETVGAGMYLIRMVSGGFSDTRKMVLLK